MILYCDTSALVKLYTDELYADVVREAAEQARIVTTHSIAYAEARAAFAKKQRSGELPESELVRVKTALDRDWPEFSVIGVDESLVRRAGDLAEQFALRGYDSVHLAATEYIHRSIGTETQMVFAVFDNRLAKAAKEVGIPVL